MTTDEQLVVINTKAFFTALTAKVKGLDNALSTNGVAITGEGWINFTQNGVSVKYLYSEDGDLNFQIGDDGSGNGLKNFKVPKIWLVT